MKVCLFRPDMPGNFGNIIRTISCFGINEIDVIRPTGFVLDQKEVKRSMMDYGVDFRINCFDNFEEYRSANDEARIILLTTKADKLYSEYSFKQGDILLFGSESGGVSEDVVKLCDDSLKIKMAEGKRSLNLAVSVGIVVSYASLVVNR
ncbi:TrmH family RNA methyltransferase [Candidatus Deianiraea vastatrix]|uniref:tRNA (cytidine(34)-2'-O)-methyltransferase n=1 Tax=Candidatus Deianiraea vastatrix TaxID=2163644 RepID=A0A5B8XGB7_9RICK|nr:TrmH family RNA methyltransferase [Candidatus Deianiraea vastatrix]QED23895.1 tRNA methyltransferase [Candidatus Deianiraea vastatrix]